MKRQVKSAVADNGSCTVVMGGVSVLHHSPLVGHAALLEVGVDDMAACTSKVLSQVLHF